MTGFVRPVGGLTGAALLASGSTYLLFVLYAQNASVADLGRYAAIYGLALLIAQLLDGGSGLLMVRDYSQLLTPAERAGTVWRTARARVLGTVLVVPLLTSVAALTLEADAAILAGSSLLVVGAAGYGLVVQVLQAQQRFRRLAALHCINAVLFVMNGVAVVAWFDQPSTAAMLAGPALALIALTLGGVPILRRAVAGRSAVHQVSRERRSVRYGVWAAAISSNIDMVLLGAVSPSTAAVYAGAQRAALGVSAASSALLAVLLPTTAAGDATRHRRLLRSAARVAIPATAIGAAAGAAMAPALGWLYRDSSLAPALVLALLLGGFTAGAVSNAPVAVLFARQRGAVVGRLTTAQAIIVVSGCAVGAWAESPQLVATVIATAKIGYLIAAIAAARRSLAATLTT